MEFCCEYARSSIGSCKACPKAISKNTVKLGFSPDFDHCGTTWFHFSCFFKKCYYRKDLKETANLDISFVFGGYDSLKETDQERLRKAYEKYLATLASGADTKKGAKRSSSANNDDDEWIPPEKKPKPGEGTKEYEIGEHMFQIDGFLFMSINKWKGLVLVAIREYYKPAKGKTLKPGKKGISLTSEQYGKLWDQRNLVNGAIDQVKETANGKEPLKKKKSKKGVMAKTEFEINDNRKICVKIENIDDEQQVIVDVREYGSPKDGGAPTEKGISLTEEQWRKVLYLHRDIVKDLSDNFDVVIPE